MSSTDALTTSEFYYACGGESPLVPARPLEYVGAPVAVPSRVEGSFPSGFGGPSSILPGL